ncbi:hypothetical protein RchiOBHm_Chr1g0346141 [Rosa chinensis]|uniref:Uncharacterized protein n=1 Tax=Rosa chinensis TaxID=74649 RepID=A0A2P6SF01_ROSCH|nr:hypothetical protein RchiOBHm_Chr1g0346141 [Rosa chinensis]
MNRRRYCHVLISEFFSSYLNLHTVLYLLHSSTLFPSRMKITGR